jgi:hypothetical protein
MTTSSGKESKKTKEKEVKKKSSKEEGGSSTKEKKDEKKVVKKDSTTSKGKSDGSGAKTKVEKVSTTAKKRPRETADEDASVSPTKPKKTKKSKALPSAESLSVPGDDRRRSAPGAGDIQQADEPPKSKSKPVIVAKTLDEDEDLSDFMNAKGGGSVGSRAKPHHSVDYVNGKKSSDKNHSVVEARSRSRDQRPLNKDKDRDRDRERGREKEKEAAKDRKRSASSQSSEAPSVSSAESSGAVERRQRRREQAGLKMASGFGLAPPPPVPGAEASTMYGPSPNPGALMLLPDKVKGLLQHQDSLAQEVLRMKLAVEAATGIPQPFGSSSTRLDQKEEAAETTLKMSSRLSESLLDPANESKLLSRTGLLSVSLNQEKHVVLRAPSRKTLQKALGQLKRVAYHCQWGCSAAKIGALLSEKPAKPVHTMVLRLAATSSRLPSHEAKLNNKFRKLRIGTQVSDCQLVLEGIAGISRKHCTITFEPEKGTCYVQDLSTNGTYLNGKRLPRPPYKNPTDARVRLFHGDELMFKMRADETEEMGYVVNLHGLS